MKYIGIIIWASLIYLVSLLSEPKEYYDKTASQRSFSWLLGFFAFLPIVWMAGTRGNFADTSIYIANFSRMPTQWSEASSYMKGVSKDFGFSWVSCWIKSHITTNATIYLTILALFQAVSLVTLFSRYSSRFGVSVFLFIASTDYISWMFNGLRQFMAVTIILFATPFMLKRKYILAILIIILASTMHQSALIMIPIMFIGMGKAWNKRTLLFILGVILSVAFVGQFTTLLDDALANTQYANVVSDYTGFRDNGTNIYRVLVYSIPALISFFGNRVIKYEDDTLINFCTNMSIVSAGLYAVSKVTSGIFLGRLPIYVSLYSYILLPWEIEVLFNNRSRKILFLFMFFAYLFFYYYQVHIAWGLI